MSERSRRKVASSASAPRPRPDPEPQPAPQAAPPQPAGWEDWLRKSRTWLPVLGLVLAAAAGAIFGLGTALLVLAASILLTAISTLWSSLQLVAGDASESAHDVVLLAAPGTEFEQKQSVLRALKDLEFERSMGKISEEDYLELRDRYRARARAVLQTIDREIEPERGSAEKLVAAYLKKQGIEPARVQPSASSEATLTQDPETKPESPEPKPEPPALKPVSPAPSLESTPKSASGDDSADRASPRCPACSTRNDADATFCKKCGQRMEEDQRFKAGAET